MGCCYGSYEDSQAEQFDKTFVETHGPKNASNSVWLIDRWIPCKGQRLCRLTEQTWANMLGEQDFRIIVGLEGRIKPYVFVLSSRSDMLFQVKQFNDNWIHLKDKLHAKVRQSRQQQKTQAQSKKSTEESTSTPQNTVSQE